MKCEKKDVGIYQIYGPHPVYGPSSLLYIGKTDKQTFSERLKQHNDSYWFSWCSDRNRNPMEICLGYLRNSGAKKIEKAEKLLIFAHLSVAFSSLIQALRPKKTD